MFATTTPLRAQRVDGVLVGPQVTVYAAPGGVAFAWISASTSTQWPTEVERLDEQPGFVLVRYSDDVTLVGWIDAAAFEARSPHVLVEPNSCFEPSARARAPGCVQATSVPSP